MHSEDCIKIICRSLRAVQKASETRPTDPLVYFKGNISSRDMECLEEEQWLNDKIINRYLEILCKDHEIFINISSFFLESFTGPKPEKLPGSPTYQIKFVKFSFQNFIPHKKPMKSRLALFPFPARIRNMFLLINLKLALVRFFVEGYFISVI